MISPTWPSGVSTPSYSRWATDIVRFGLKPSFRLASCWSVDVVNGGAGLRFDRLIAIDSTIGRLARSRGDVALGGLAVADDRLRPVDPDELGAERRPARRDEERLDRPVLDRRERPDLALPIDHEANGDRLDPAGRQSRADLARDQRAERVADHPVDDPARLLGIDEVLVDRPGVGEGLADRRLGDLAERHPAVRSGARPIASATCQAIASPSRSRSVAR